MCFVEPRKLGLVMLLAFIAIAVPACDLLGGPGEPIVEVTSPDSFTQVQVGENVDVVTTASDDRGVTRVELWVDGVLYHTEANPSPDGETTWTLVQTWTATTPGVHNLAVVAYNVDGAESDPWAIAIEVVEGPLTVATATATLPAGTPPPEATDAPPPPAPTDTAPPPTEPAGPTEAPAITYFRANGTEGSISVAPGTTVTLSWEWERVQEGYLDPGSIAMVCPAMPCNYDVSPGSTTTYTLRAVNAVDAVEATVTVEITPVAPPDLRVTDLAISPGVLIKNTPFHALATLHNDGTGALSNVTVRVEDHFSHPQVSCSNMDMATTIHETTVNLDAGQSLPVDYTVMVDSAWEHLICMKVDPDNDVAESDDDNNAQGEMVLVGTQTTIPLDEANSGSIRADGNELPLGQPGDASNDQRVKGFLSWDLSAIPSGALILHADVGWNTHCFHGGAVVDCAGASGTFTHLGTLSVRAYYYDALDSGDFASSGLSGGSLLQSYASQPTGDFDVTDAVAAALTASRPLQLYTFFSNPTDGNGYYDGLRFEEGGGANTLTVVHMP
jgi:hypothetical protein